MRGICRPQQKAIPINRIRKPNLDVLTVSLFCVIYYGRRLAWLTCDCAALVVFYCFHQHEPPFYDLSKHHTLILTEATGRMKEEMKEAKDWPQRGEDITAKKRKKECEKERKNEEGATKKNKNERQKKENKDRRERVRCGPFISRLLQGISGQHTCYYSLQRK